VKILTVVGARPQFVKAAPVSRVLATRHQELLVHTGQHYDDAMSASFFRDLEMSPPALNLEVGSGPHGAQTAEIMRRLEPVVLAEEPDGVLVYGDTNSTLAGALVASKVHYPDGRRPWLAHVEAGDEQLWGALDAVDAREWAEALPDGLETVVGAGGSGAHARREPRPIEAQAVLREQLREVRMVARAVTPTHAHLRSRLVGMAVLTIAIDAVASVSL